MHPSLLIILDGLGYRSDAYFNALAAAQAPYLKQWMTQYPMHLLHASGTAVGLPEGYMGNSQVGHLTLGAGRIIKQPLTIINQAIDNGSLKINTHLTALFQTTHNNKGRLHIMGLLSDAGVHSHIHHLFAYMKYAHEAGLSVVVHSFLDGRDVPPKSASLYLEMLDAQLAHYPHTILGSLQGRWYAMDRDHHWKRTSASYHVLTTPYTGPQRNWKEVLQQSYDKNITDEFIIPTALVEGNEIRPNDTLLIYNFRPDRMRQLTHALSDSSFTHFQRKRSVQTIATPFLYDSTLSTISLLSLPIIKNTLTQVLAEHDIPLFTTAETEKYAHVTYFFNGYKEEPVKGETRRLIPSLNVATYEQHPHMSAEQITETVCKALHSQRYNFYLINYANADMVGHSGDFAATVAAIEYLDQQLGIIYQQAVEKYNATLYIVGDHGKAEEMRTDSMIRTSHTTHPVPFVIINGTVIPTVKLWGLADVAPYILRAMHIPIPPEMTGSQSLD